MKLFFIFPTLFLTVSIAADSKTFLSHGAAVDESTLAVPGKFTVLLFTADW